MINLKYFLKILESHTRQHKLNFDFIIYIKMKRSTVFVKYKSSFEACGGQKHSEHLYVSDKPSLSAGLGGGFGRRVGSGYTHY